MPAFHAVEPGDTLYAIALRYGVLLGELVAANDIADPSLIRVGEILLIPGSHCQEEVRLREPFLEVAWQPQIPRQGDTIRLEVATSSPLDSITGTFGGRTFKFLSKGTQHVAYVGVYAMAEPGLRQLALSTPDGQTQRISVPVRPATFGVERIRLTPDRSRLLAPEIVQRENQILATVTATFTPEQLWHEPFRLPLDGDHPVQSSFGTRRAYNDGPVSSFHGGTDFGGTEGTPIFASAAGKVVLAHELDIRGNTVIIDHGLGVYTLYCHLSRIDVKEGDMVPRGEKLGLLGNTGLSTGPHLHWEMRVQGVRVDAMRWVGLH